MTHEHREIKPLTLAMNTAADISLKRRWRRPKTELIEGDLRIQGTDDYKQLMLDANKLHMNTPRRLQLTADQLTVIHRSF